MSDFIVVYRVFAVAIIAYWAWQLVGALQKPVHWQPAPRPQRAQPFRLKLSRNQIVVAGFLGIAAGVAVLAFSFILPSL